MKSHEIINQNDVEESKLEQQSIAKALEVIAKVENEAEDE
jgi:hypothetical protein